MFILSINIVLTRKQFYDNKTLSIFQYIYIYSISHTACVAPPCLEAFVNSLFEFLLTL